MLTSAPDRRVTTAIAGLVASSGESGNHEFDVVAVVLARSTAAAAAPHLLDVLGASPGVPVLVHDPAPRRERASWRREHEQAVVDALTPLAPDLVLLLGYELIAGPTLLDAWPMVNVHPALPDGPVGPERAVIDSLVASNATETGLTSHVVTAELDRGPVICALRIEIPPTPRTWPRPDPRRIIADLHGAAIVPLLIETLRRLDAGLVAPADDRLRGRGSSAAASQGTR